MPEYKLSELYCYTCTKDCGRDCLLCGMPMVQYFDLMFDEFIEAVYKLGYYQGYYGNMCKYTRKI